MVDPQPPRPSPGATPPKSVAPDGRGARIALLTAVVLTGLLYVVPYGHVIGRPLVWLSTYAHECGHGIAAMLVGGHFERFQMWPDGSGVASSLIPQSRIARALVSAGGLMGPAVLAAFFFLFGRRPRAARAGLVFFAATSLFILLFKMSLFSNPFGWVFVALVVAGTGAVAIKAPTGAAQLLIVFLAVQLSMSVFSRGDYLFTDVANTSGGAMPSDTAQMAEALFLPYWFWGALVGAFSVAVLALGLWLFLRGGGAKKPAAETPRLPAG